MQGGLLLLNAIRENKTITNLALSGNCISEDIVFSIEKRLRENRCLCSATKYVLSADAESIKSRTTVEKNDFMASIASREISLETAPVREQQLLIPRRKETFKIQTLRMPANVMETNGRIDLSVEKNSKINAELENKSKIHSNTRANSSSRDASDDRAIGADAKIVDLGKMLQERTAVIDLLTNEIATKVAEVDDTRTQLNLLQAQVNRLREDRKKFHSDKAREIAELRKNYDEVEENWRKNYKDLKNNYNECSRNRKEAESKVPEY